jgi:lysophospholipase L1-like esterase
VARCCHKDSHQWHSSTTPNFSTSGGTAIGGATSSTYTATPTGTQTYYRCVVTDNASATVTSFQRAVLSQFTNQPLTVVAIGDSTGNSPSPDDGWPVALCDLLRERGYANATPINKCVSGSATSTWNTGGTNMNAVDTAVAAIVGNWICCITIGINDAQGGEAAATFGSQLSTMISHVLGLVGATSQGPLAVYVSYPTWREPGFYSGGTTFDESTSVLLPQYNSQVDALINGTTIKAGDLSTVFIMNEFPNTYLIDESGSSTGVGRIHPNEAGRNLMAEATAQAVAPVTTGGAGGAVFSRVKLGM